MVMGDFDIGTIISTLPNREEIVGVMLQEMGVGTKRSTTRTCSMLEKVLMELGEVDLSIVPDLLPSIIQFIMVDHLVFKVIVIIEVDIGIISANFLHITMVA